MSLPAWCRAEQHMEEEDVRGTHSAGEAGGVCRAGWGVWWSCSVPVCSTRRVCVFTHVCTGVRPCREFGKAPVDPCGGILLPVPGGAVCVPRGCVAEHSPCACLAVQWQHWPLPWHLLHTGTARLRQLEHVEGMWGLCCLFQTR